MNSENFTHTLVALVVIIFIVSSTIIEVRKSDCQQFQKVEQVKGGGSTP
jgi:3-dehydroquinate dehydratase